METLLKHVYQIRLPLPFRLNHVNSYLIRDDEGWSVIDPGLDTLETEDAWHTVFRHFELAPADIHAILVTHFHPDHYGFAGKLQQWSGAPLMASPLTFSLAERCYSIAQVDRTRLFYRSCGMPEEQVEEASRVDRQLLAQIAPAAGKRLLIDGGETIQLGGQSFEIIIGGGHAEGSIGFWNEEHHLLIGGDMLLQRITPNIPFDGDSEDNPLQRYFETLHALQQQKIRTVLPGHGRSFDLEPGFIDNIIGHHRTRLLAAAAIVEAAAGEPVAPYDICMKLFPNVRGIADVRFALAETAVHLRYLDLFKQWAVPFD